MNRILFAFSLGVLAGCSPQIKQTSQLPAGSFEPYPAPAFSLTERSGKTITKDDLKGTIWVASFVFTRCNGPCPTISASMAKLQAELLPTRPNVKLVTFTVDPDRDTPEELKKYAANFRADSDRWLFLTGKEETVRSLLREGFKINATKKDEPKPGDEFDHNSKLMVINAKGEICALFDGMKRQDDTDGSQFANEMKKLTATVDALSK